MVKVLHGRDIRPDCEAVVVADGDEDVLVQVAVHAKSVRGMTHEQINDPEFVAHARNQIYEQA